MKYMLRSLLGRMLRFTAVFSNTEAAVKKLQWLVPLIALALDASAVRADTMSYTGTFASPESYLSFVITLATPSTVDLQTYGFGGGTNAAGTVISAGGTDPFLAIFSGTGSGATMLNPSSPDRPPADHRFQRRTYGPMPRSISSCGASCS
jgi:hypothetical protein